MDYYKTTLLPTGTKMSEKYNGVQGVWTGKELQTKTGLKINAPEWFINSLPSHPIIGELFAGYGKLHEATSVVLASLQGQSKDWNKIQFCIFSHEKIENLPAHCFCVDQHLIENEEHRKTFRDYVLSKGGEGLVYLLPNGDTLKSKPRPDAEARVIGIKEGKGRNAGLIGSLICEFEGKKFNIGTGLADDDRYQSHDHFLGKTVTFSYFELSKNGIPTQPAYMHIREID